MNDTMVPRDDAEFNEALYNAIIRSQSTREQYSSQGAELQWFAERVLQYVLQYSYQVSVPCFSSLLSQYIPGNGCSRGTFI